MASNLIKFRIRLVAALFGLVIVVAACTSPSGAGAPPSAVPNTAASAAPVAPVSGAPVVPGY